MKIITCVKQVPATSEVEIDPITGNLIRDGNDVKLNPFDLYNIETTLRIKEKLGAETVAISMGPPQALRSLEEAMWMGLDDAVLLSDRRLGGADVVATSYALSQGIKKLGDFDLIVCGKQTTDGDTAQVGPEIAEHLNIPHVSYVSKIIEVTDKEIVCETILDQNIQTVSMSYPCLITVEKGIFTPRLPSYRRLRELTDKKIPVYTIDDLADKDQTHYGLKGSPTQVERMFPPHKNTDHLIYSGEKELPKLLLKLKELKVV